MCLQVDFDIVNHTVPIPIVTEVWDFLPKKTLPKNQPHIISLAVLAIARVRHSQNCLQINSKPYQQVMKFNVELNFQVMVWCNSTMERVAGLIFS